MIFSSKTKQNHCVFNNFSWFSLSELGQDSEEASRYLGNLGASEEKKSLQLFSDGPRGASDHWKDLKNETSDDLRSELHTTFLSGMH